MLQVALRNPWRNTVAASLERDIPAGSRQERWEANEPERNHALHPWLVDSVYEVDGLAAYRRQFGTSTRCFGVRIDAERPGMRESLEDGLSRERENAVLQTWKLCGPRGGTIRTSPHTFSRAKKSLEPQKAARATGPEDEEWAMRDSNVSLNVVPYA